MKKVFVLLMILFVTWIVEAQTDSTKVYRIILTDNSEITGTMISSSDSQLVFLTLSGIEMRVPKLQIREQEIVSGKFDGTVFYKSDPNKTRLFFAPTGRMLNPGEGYFSVYEIFFPSISIGLTSFLSVNGGMTLIPGLEEQLFFISPKIGFATSDNFSVGAGLLYIGIPEEDPFGILYSVATIGSDRNALTLGGGFGLSEGEIPDSPVFMLGGEVSLSNSVKLISENWILTTEDSHPIVSFGIRFYGEHIAGDFGLFIPTGIDIEGFPGLPWIGFIYNY